MYGDGRVFWRGGSWHIAYSHNAREVRTSAHTDNKTRAKAMLRDELKKLRTDAWVDPKDRKATIGELVEDLKQHYITNKKLAFADDLEMRWRLHLAKHFEHLSAAALSADHQRKYRTARLEEKAANATINRELQVIRRAYRLAAKHEPRPKVTRVPNFLIVKEDNARKEFFTMEQLKKLQSAASMEGLWARVLVDMAYSLGWRRGELLGLSVKDVNIADRTVRLQTSKNGEPRECPLSSEIALMLHQLISGRAADDKIFPTVDQFRGAWKRIRKAAGVKTMLFHSLRRTSARNKRDAGVDSSVILAMQGWKTEAMLRRYAIVDLNNQRDALRKLGQHSDNQQTGNA